MREKLNTFIGDSGLTYVIATSADGRVLGRIELNKFKQMFSRSTHSTQNNGLKIRGWVGWLFSFGRSASVRGFVGESDQ